MKIELQLIRPSFGWAERENDAKEIEIEIEIKVTLAQYLCER
jgi:hypothetical protein